MAGTTFSQFTPINIFPDWTNSGGKVLMTTGDPITTHGGGLTWGVVPITAGGTGKTTAQEGLDALSIGDLNMSGVSSRIRGDFSNNDASKRVVFTTSKSNGFTSINVAPNGTCPAGDVTAKVVLEDNTSLSTGSGSLLRLETIQSTETRVTSGQRGAGAYLPLALRVNGFNAVNLTSPSGNTVMTVASGTGSTNTSQLLLKSSVSNGTVALTVISNSGSPYGQLMMGASTMSMMYDAKTHAFRSQTGSNLLTIGNVGQLSFGASADVGTTGYLLLSGGSSGTPYWSNSVPPSVSLTGATQPAGTSNTTFATTEFTQTAISNYNTNIASATYAPIDSPTLTGNPKAPTPSLGDNDTSIATSAFVTSTVNTAVNGTVNNSNKLGGYYASASATPNTIALRDGSANLYAVLFYGQATSARYADLAEKYTMDREYQVGTLVIIGDDEGYDCTHSHEVNQHVLGVISDKPAYLMNADAEGQAVALTGRVPVRVIGPIKKGQRIVSSSTAGCGIVGVNGSFFATALETNTDADEKLVECAIVR